MCNFNIKTYGKEGLDEFSEADKQGQDKVVPILKEMFKKCKDVVLEQHYEDKGGIDIYLTATTHKGYTKKYAIECKDRDYSHTSFSVPYKETPAGWVIDVPKYEKMVKAANDGYMSLYLNTFSDNTYYVWDVVNSNSTYGKYKAGKTTVKKSEKIDKWGYFYTITDYVVSGTIDPPSVEYPPLL